MSERMNGNDGPNQSNCSESSNDYLQRAARACEAGDLVLGMYLYLAAYEQAAVDPAIPEGMAVAGLQEAWHLACDLKERSMAEYVFEKLEPFLMPDEIAAYAAELQDLALDRLEEFGFSREELEDMAEMISEGFIGDSVMKVESISIPRISAPSARGQRDNTVRTDAYESVQEQFEQGQVAPDGQKTAETAADINAERERRFEPTTAAKKDGSARKMGMGVAPVDGFNPYDMLDTSMVGTSVYAATNEGSGAFSFTLDKDRAAQARQAQQAQAQAQLAQQAQDAQAAPGAPAGETQDTQTTQLAKTPDAHDVQLAKTDQAGQAQPARESALSRQAQADEAAKMAGAFKKPGERQASSQETKTFVNPYARDVQSARDPENTAIQAAGGKKGDLPQMPPEQPAAHEPLTYRNLVGYDEAISVMRDFGIGLQRDRSFQNFVSMLNSRHGLTRMPALDTVLLRAPVIEDAMRFLEATAGEIGLPVLRMTMEDNPQGVPVLCVSTQGGNRPRMNHAQNRFEAPAILVLDDLDMWVMPQMPEGLEGIGGFMAANISRGAREAVNLIRSAVEDPEVYVLATATTSGEVDPFFYELLEPMTIVDISDPTEYERDAIWTEIMSHHPSMRFLHRPDLTRLSAGLARYDIYMTAREAIEEAYKTGLMQRMFVPVTPQNVYDKLAACHALDSEQYQVIEDEIIREFRHDLEHLEDLID